MKNKVQLGDGDASLIRYGMRFFLYQLLFVLSKVVPHRKGSILIGAGLGKRFMGNPKYLYLELLRQRRENPALVHRLQPLEPFSTAFLARLNTELVQRNWVLLVKKHHLDKALTIQQDLTHIIEDGLATNRFLRYMSLRSSGYGVSEAAEASPAVELLEAT
jgi:hypothetical protein